MGISFLKIEHICLSHIHGDHLFGLFGLLSTMGMLGRTAELSIYAPKNFHPVLKFFLSYFGEGLLFHINYVRKEAIGKYGLSLSEIGALKRGEDVVRPAGPLTHACIENGFCPCSGTDEPLVIPNSEAAYVPFVPRSYAYCSDTAPFPELPEWVKGVSLLYHESTFPKDMADMAAKTFHSTTVQAARCALEAGAGRLLVGHYSSRFHSVDFFLDELREIFPNTELARDRTSYEIPLVRQ